VKAVAAAVSALAIVAAPAARAWACGGGDGDGGSSGGGGDSGGGDSGGDSSYSSDSGSDGSSSASVGCVETSEVLGRRQCGEFGEWAMPAVLPPITIELGTSVRSFGLGSLRLGGTIDHEEHGSYQYSMVGGGAGEGQPLAIAGGFDVRMLLGRRLYGGVEASIGGISADERAMQMVTTDAMPGATLSPTVQLHLTGGAVVGARLPLGDFQLAAEVLGGTRMVQVSLHSQYGACETTEYERHVTAVVEPRLRLDYWATPWVALGAFAGTDLLSKDSQVFGVYIGGHARAFDGLR
jgi:hypothetical protein